MSEFENKTITPWGYMADAEFIPDLLTASEYDGYTGSKFHGDARINACIPSASAAIRDYCGWHISPNLTCGIFYRVADLRDAFVGKDLLVQLPATYVTAVKKVILNATWNEDEQKAEGDVITDFDYETNGLLRIYDADVCDRRSKIFVKYEAGFPEYFQTDAVKELAANLVSHSVTNTYGVNSETVGGVSVSYNSVLTGRSPITLSADTREVLNHYKVRGVF